MKKRATVADVATRAGVSVATVDRVLNRRRPVRAETASAVLSAAEALDYYAAPLMRRRIPDSRPHRSFGFILQKRSKRFYRELAAAIEAEMTASPVFRGTAEIVFVDALSPTDLAAALGDLGGRVDAVAAVSIDHPHVVDEIERLRAKGVPTVTLLSALSAAPVAGHAGPDNRKAGRAAAWAIRHCAPRRGQVAVLVGSHRYGSHEDREIGFRSYFRERQPGFEILQSAAYLDDDPGAYEAMLEVLGWRERPVGCYLVGGGQEGALRALLEEDAAGEMAFVCHQLDRHTRDGLLDGAIDLVIDTPVRDLAAAALQQLSAALGDAPDAPVGDGPVPFTLHISETI